MKKDVKISLMENGKLSRGGWLSIVAFLLVAVIALSVALGLVVKAGKAKKGMEEAYVGGGMVLPEETEENGISLASTVIPKEQYEEYGIMPIAETSYSVTATAKAQGGVTLSEAQQKFNWSLAWASSNSSDVNTYVSLSASEGARTATVSLLKPFSTQILLKCTWAYNDTQTGSVTLDYAKRFKGFNVQYASSVAKSASDETHLSTMLLENQASHHNSKVIEIHLASPFVDGSWQNGPWNATVFRVVEPVFDSVGTIENSVVNVSNTSGVYPETMSTVDHISNQMCGFTGDGLYENVLYDESIDDYEPEKWLMLGDREEGALVPRDTRSFTQIYLLKSGFLAAVKDEVDAFFGTSTSAPSNLSLCYSVLQYYSDNVGSLSMFFPGVINLQYGGSVEFEGCIDFQVTVDLPSASSIDFTKSNFIF